MPTYEYECTACGHEFERFESIKSEPSKQCPKCKGRKAQRRISGGGGLIFKGSGFYCTDYRSSAATASRKKDSKPAETKPCCGTSCEKAIAKGDCPAVTGKS